ncbi:conserved protein of unknown function [Rhodovastum atsumiense]|uniref:Uncharacterized protein n=1 Tax=Rhodovastum atsumiense TaxID=504468 RepID=A0A5M6IM79_9PROT|nr:hypothetical protein [Rhodovastum atsumiense]KAA5609356.1 hypothetical protein F1189_24480 [Rhodovastum atsumiense]CAH2605076.1 conserved protein of unknown function [Rhodovastum atsumiense]
MWLFTTFGFFSIVEKGEDRGTGMVTVRARVRGDLEALRLRYLPTLGEIVETPERDYGCRARVPKEDLAGAVGRITMDIDYTNFKGEVAMRMGYAREQIYHEVWETLFALQPPVATESRRG